MIDTQMFHIYDKETSKPVKVCMTVEELEQMIAKRENIRTAKTPLIHIPV